MLPSATKRRTFGHNSIDVSQDCAVDQGRSKQLLTNSPQSGPVKLALKGKVRSYIIHIYTWKICHVKVAQNKTKKKEQTPYIDPFSFKCLRKSETISSLTERVTKRIKQTLLTPILYQKLPKSPVHVTRLPAPRPANQILSWTSSSRTLRGRQREI